jgi:TPR repeat protein
MVLGPYTDVEDPSEAMRWYRLRVWPHFKKKRRRGRGCQFKIRLCYLYGNGVDRDDTEAVRWVRLDDNQGYAEAQSAFAQLRI